MDHKDEKLIGICGLYCGTCPSYLAWKTNDIEVLHRRAEEYGYTVEQLCCEGCLSDNLMPLCEECPHGFRACAEEHGVTWCFECSAFPCARLESFKDVHVVGGISHHEHVVEELEYMRQHGTEAWLEKIERENRCPGCGTMLYWYLRRCLTCGANVRL